jgi:hypothetical protein
MRLERNGEELRQGIEIRPGEDILDLRITIEDGRFTISGLAAGTYELTLNTYKPPPHQTTRLLPTMKQTVTVTDANEA